MSRSPSRVDAANMSAAMSSHWVRTNVRAVVEEMPFDRMLEAEEDGISEEPPGEYEFAQRRAAIRGFFRYILSEGDHPLKMMKKMYAAGAGMRIEPFVSLTMDEQALMLGESKAAVSWRLKVLSGKIKLTGLHGARLAGQKTESSTPSFSAAQKGNSNRKKKRRRKSREALP